MTLSLRSIARVMRSCPHLVATVATLPMLSTPLLAETVSERVYSTSRFTWALTAMPRTWSADTLRRARFAVEQRVADYQATNVRVNRTVPKVDAPVLASTFGARTTTDDIRRARMFPEPLVPVGREPSEAENTALGRVLERFGSGSANELAMLDQYLDHHPTTPWRASLAANAGVLYARQGYFTRAWALWDQAWSLAKNGNDPASRAVADFAVGQWLQQATTFGHVQNIKQRLAEIEGRDLRGTAAVQVGLAREGLAFLETQHDMATFSGPEALKALLAARDLATPGAIEGINAYRPPHRGTPLADLARLAQQHGLNVRLIYTARVADIPVPSIVHLRAEHFSALVRREGDQVLARDVILGGERWFSEAALRAEASGYFLVPIETRAPSGARAVSDEEAAQVYGRCQPGAPYEDPCGCGGGPPPPGMPVYRLHPVTTSLILRDTPLGYTPPIGPPVRLELGYHQRENRQPQTFDYGNVGARWTWSWLSYVTDNNTATLPPYTWYSVYLRGDAQETFLPSTMTHFRSQATLVKVTETPIRWERRLPDGTVEVFTLPDRPPTAPNRRVFLTEVIDPQGHTLAFTYDSSFRMVAVTDALGQVTTLEYLDTADPLRLTKVTDPFGRAATLSYDAAGRLASITDVIGMTSSFAYGTADFVSSMTTPYGTTQFQTSDSPYRRLEVTDPMGGRERLEFRWSDTSLPTTVPAGDVPAGFANWNADMHKYLSLHWDKLAMATSPGDINAATMTHWIVGFEPAQQHGYSRNIPHAIKRPLETRVWYQYPSQSPASARWAGVGALPNKVARVLEGGATQLTQMAYNAQQQVTSRIDPLGRTTTYTYAINGLDVLEVRQVNGGGTDLLASYSNYNARHLPASSTDAAGQTTTFTYNPAGQVLTVTNPKNETTTYTYDAVTGEQLTVSGPVAGTTMTYTYDGYGRARTITEPDGYAVTLDYDALDRPTKRTYPDTTYDETTYARLDVAQERDRLGRITRHFYDGAGRRTGTRDPLGRLIQEDWCSCGSLRALVDGNGNRTTWERDVAGRVTREVRADGVTDTLYTYDATGRLKTITDPKDQVTTHTYATDDRLLSMTFTNAQIATPGVTYTYDAIYPRVGTMVDGTGTTTYAHKPAGQLGAGQVASVDGPLTDDTITYDYDELGRVTSRAINGTANTVTWTFDALGRVTSEANLLGTFSYTYDGGTNRLAMVTYPNNQTSTYSYLPANQDHRLQTIHHKYPNESTLSKFDYTYDALGNIVTWQQQADGAPVRWKYGYDAADQLTAVLKESTDPTPQILKRYAYAYDPAGNRTMEQIDDAPLLAAHNNLNRLISQTAGGPTVFAGTTNEPATITIQGKPAAMDANNTFRGTAATTVGTTTATIVATDTSGNSTTEQWEFDVTGSGQTFTYDANGNLTADGMRPYEWDALNQLTSITAGSRRTEFHYDGQRQRVRTIEKEGGIIQSDTRSLWCNDSICEFRESGQVSRSRFLRGEQSAGTSQFIVRDHLNSPTAVSDAAGALLTRYEFSPWGETVVVTGPDVTMAGYTGHEKHSLSGLTLSKHRAFDNSLGRWLSEDPIGLAGGVNLYAYVQNAPLSFVDPLGLQCQEVSRIPLGTLRRTISDVPDGPAELVSVRVSLRPAGILGLRGVFRPTLYVDCRFEQQRIRQSVVSRYYLGIFKCLGECGASSLEYEVYSEDHMETQRYTRRWGFAFTMHPNTAWGAAARGCRERQR